MALLEVTNLAKSYGSVEAVKGISFHIESGRCVSLLGPNGAGKTTVLKMLAQLISPTSGQIKFDVPHHQDVRSYIGYLPQQPAFHEWMTANEFLEYIGRLSNMQRSEVLTRRDKVLEMVGLKDVARRKIGGFSGGMRQRLGIAQALIHRPRLLIMDEPVSALDPVGRREVLELMGEIRQETTILYSTHVLHDAEEISDDILILVQGQIVVDGDLSGVREQFQQPLVKIQGEVALEPWHSVWAQIPGVQLVTGSGAWVELTVEDLAGARIAILQSLTEQNIPVRSVEFGLTSLEDLFMKVVKS